MSWDTTPAIWEAIAATGWSSLRVKQVPTPKRERHAAIANATKRDMHAAIGNATQRNRNAVIVGTT
jgi:hypothetical protein